MLTISLLRNPPLNKPPTATYWLKIANFFSTTAPLLFSALVQGDPVRIYGQPLRILKLEFFRQPMVKIW